METNKSRRSRSGTSRSGTSKNAGRLKNRRERRRRRNKNKTSSTTKTFTDDEIDYYHILGLDKDATDRTIKRVCRELLNKYNPDKNKNLEGEEKELNKEMYKIVLKAYEILGHKERRRAYDTSVEYEQTHQGFKDQKSSFEEFLKLQKAGMSEEDKNLSKLKFEMTKRELDSKHGYDSAKEEAIDPEDLKRRVTDSAALRKQEDEEIRMNTRNLFEGKAFNPEEFNKYFLKQQKKMERREKRRRENGELVLADDDNGILAYNDGYDGEYAPVDSYSTLYSEGQFNGVSESFAGVGQGMLDLNRDEDEYSDYSIDSDDIANTYNTHNDKPLTADEMDDLFNREKRERKNQNEFFKGEEFKKEYGTAMDDKFGISKDFGFLVGNSRVSQGHQMSRRKKQRNKKRRDLEKQALRELALDTN